MGIPAFIAILLVFVVGAFAQSDIRPLEDFFLRDEIRSNFDKQKDGSKQCMKRVTDCLPRKVVDGAWPDYRKLPPRKIIDSNYQFRGDYCFHSIKMSNPNITIPLTKPLRILQVYTWSYLANTVAERQRLDNYQVFVDDKECGSKNDYKYNLRDSESFAYPHVKDCDLVGQKITISIKGANKYLVLCEVKLVGSEIN